MYFIKIYLLALIRSLLSFYLRCHCSCRSVQCSASCVPTAITFSELLLFHSSTVTYFCEKNITVKLFLFLKTLVTYLLTTLPQKVSWYLPITYCHYWRYITLRMKLTQVKMLGKIGSEFYWAIVVIFVCCVCFLSFY